MIWRIKGIIQAFKVRRGLKRQMPHRIWMIKESVDGGIEFQTDGGREKADPELTYASEALGDIIHHHNMQRCGEDWKRFLRPKTKRETEQ